MFLGGPSCPMSETQRLEEESPKPRTTQPQLFEPLSTEALVLQSPNTPIFPSLEFGNFPASHHGPPGAFCGMKAWLQPPWPGAQPRKNKGPLKGLGFRVPSRV